MAQVFGSDAGQIIIACVLSTVLFAALIIYISKHPQKRTIPLKTAFIIMFLGGMALYCTCYYLELKQAANSPADTPYLEWVKHSGNSWFYFLPYVVEMAVMDVGMMFYGRGNSSVFYSLPISKNPLAVILFWFIHLIAFFTAASALLIRFGNDLLKWIRLMTSKISDVDIIFGVNPDSLAFGRNIADSHGNMLVYVDSVIRDDFDSSIRELGGLAYYDRDAVKAAPSFLKNIRVNPRKTRLRLFALSGEYDKNLQYARLMADTLKNSGIPHEHTELVLLGTEEWKGMYFQADETQHGYGSVISFDEY